MVLLVGAFSHPQWAVYFFPTNTTATPSPTTLNNHHSKDSIIFSFFNSKPFNHSSLHNTPPKHPLRSAHQLFYDNVLLLLLIFSGSLIISTFLIYGTLSGKPQYVTPFFCILVFHLCFSGMSFLGYFSDVPNVKKFIGNMPHFRFKDKLLSLDNDHLTLLSVLFSVSILSAMVYCIGVVWGCYKYLKYRELFMGTSGRMRDYEMGSVTYNRSTEDTEMLLPPKYEDVIRMSLEECPPPAYNEEGQGSSGGRSAN